MVTLDANANWEVLLLPKDKKTIGCKWLYKVKHNVDGFMNKYKTRLVVKDYSQIYDIHYDALPSPKLGPRWALVYKTMKLWGLEGTLPALDTKKAKGAC
jgi:hypothetical protein